MWAIAQRDIGGALCKSSVIPFLVPCHKLWLMPTARVVCSNAANIGEHKTWTQSEFCTWQNSISGARTPKNVYTVRQPRKWPNMVQSLVDLHSVTSSDSQSKCQEHVMQYASVSTCARHTTVDSENPTTREYLLDNTLSGYCKHFSSNQWCTCSYLSQQPFYLATTISLQQLTFRKIWIWSPKPWDWTAISCSWSYTSVSWSCLERLKS